MYKKLLKFTILQINIKNTDYIFLFICKIHARVSFFRTEKDQQT